MPDDNMNEQRDLAAGDFSSWMNEIINAIRCQRTSDVPCAGCTACCTASQFIHLGPDETDTLFRIPAELQFPAPGLPDGHVLLGYDERGHCPMLTDNHCSIYQHRPRTCRTYDCRIFPAAGLTIEEDKVLLARQARRWHFSFPSEADRKQHEALRAAATFLRQHPDQLPTGTTLVNTTQLAVLALQVHPIFLRRDEGTGHTTVVHPDPEVLRAEVTRLTKARRATLVGKPR